MKCCLRRGPSPPAPLPQGEGRESARTLHLTNSILLFVASITTTSCVEGMIMGMAGQVEALAQVPAIDWVLVIGECRAWNPTGTVARSGAIGGEFAQFVYREGRGDGPSFRSSA